MFKNIELQTGVERIALPDEMPKTLTDPLYIHNESIDNVYFYIDSFKKSRISDAETDALSLINTMLTETLYSRILGTAREHGLVYSMSSGFGHSKQSSNWWFGAQVMPKNAGKLFDIITRELEAVFEAKIDDEDVRSAKQYALGRYQRGGQTVGGIAAGYSGRYFFDEVIEDYYDIPNRIDAVTKESIVAVSRAMFEDNVWGLGCLGSPGEAFIAKLHRDVTPLWNR